MEDVSVLFNMLFFLTFLKFCDAADTLPPNETISGNQTLVSQNQVFEMGFFTPGASNNTFLGVWYKNTPKVVVWVANRNNPITDPQGVVFGISRNGTLSISRARSVIWSRNSPGPPSNPVLHLLDNGNMVVVDTTKDGYIWQGFDYPTDTWLPGMKLVDDSDAGLDMYLTSWRDFNDPSPGDFAYWIENEGMPELVVFEEEKKLFRTGTWNGLYFGGLPPLPKGSETGYLFKEERLISVTRPNISSVFSRTTLEPSGLLQRYNMNANQDSWNPVVTYPRDKCDEYGLCGPYSVCTIDKSRFCDCFVGYAPKSPNEWDNQDWSGGCTRITPLNCQSGDGFVEVKGVKYPDMLRDLYLLNTSMSLGECKAECLKNCNCTACASLYITNGGSDCVMWIGNLLGMRQFPEADYKQNIYVRVPEGYSDSEKEKKKQKMAVILASCGVVILVLLFGGAFFVRWKRQASNDDNEDIELEIFKLETIEAATDNFSRKKHDWRRRVRPSIQGEFDCFWRNSCEKTFKNFPTRPSRVQE